MRPLTPPVTLNIVDHSVQLLFFSVITLFCLIICLDLTSSSNEDMVEVHYSLKRANKTRRRKAELTASEVSQIKGSKSVLM